MDADAIDPESAEFAEVNWDKVSPAEFELDPVLVERIRARQRLRQITLRVGQEQIDEARRVAQRTGEPYQRVLRRWLAQGASIARTQRLKKGRGAR